jgi:negative regulator of sigma E activity
MEWVQTPSGINEISFKRYVRRKDGQGFNVVTDDTGRTVAVIADDGEWNRSFDPRTRTLTISHSMRTPMDERSIKARVRRILSSYRVSYAGMDVMAGRTCHKLILDPHDVHGRPIKVWIDAVTGISLARSESDRRGHTFGMTTFNSISYPKTLAAAEIAFTVPKGTRIVRVSRSPLFKDPGSLSKWGGIDIQLPLSMPRGYELEAAELISLANTPTVCLRYSDGLAVITIFQTQSAKAVEQSYENVAWKMLPRGESLAVSGQTRVTSVVMGPRESDGIVSVARALDRQRESDARERIALDYGIRPAEISRLRGLGLGMDCLAGLFEISRRTRRKLETLLAIKRDGWSWRDIAVGLKIDPEIIAPRVLPYECH